MRRSVISIRVTNEIEIRLRKDKATIGMRGHVFIFGSVHGELYVPNTMTNGINCSSDYFVCVNTCVDDLKILWHMRLWHINKNRISRMVKVGLLPDLGKVECPICEPRLTGKIVKKPLRN